MLLEVKRARLKTTLSNRKALAKLIDLSTILGNIQSSDNGELLTEVDASWLQGRTAFGGIGAALGVRAMTDLVDAKKPLRSMMTNFVGPLQAGPVKVTTEILREGKSASQAEARVYSGAKIATTISAAYGAPRDTLDVPAPDVQLNSSPDDYLADEHTPRQPAFLKHFDIRWKGNGVPYSGTRDVTTEMWVRHRSDVSLYPNEKMVTICDIPPGAILSWYTKPAMLSSQTWILDFLYPAEEITGDWFHLEYRLLAARGGYSHQSGRIRDENGRLVAISHQCMVYFEPK